MTPRPRLSIIIPVFNASAHLPEALDSVFAQTSVDFELIAVDDGSTDDSLQILNEYAQRHPQMIVRSVTHSGSAAVPRNTALEMAKGEYVFFVDSDDLIEPKTVENLLAAADESGSDIVLCKMEQFGQGTRGVPRRVFEQERRGESFFESFAYRTVGPTKMFRRRMLDEHKIRFPLGYRDGEDQAFTMRAYFAANHISAISDQIYYWVRNRLDGDASVAGGINASLIGQSASEDLAKNLAVIAVIAEHTEPGIQQTILLERFLSEERGLSYSFDERFLALSDQEQDAFIERSVPFAHLWSDYLRNRANSRARAILDAVFTGSREETVRVVERTQASTWILATLPAGRRSTHVVVQGPVKALIRVVDKGRTYYAPATKLDDQLGVATVPATICPNTATARFMAAIPEGVYVKRGFVTWFSPTRWRRAIAWRWKRVFGN